MDREAQRLIMTHLGDDYDKYMHAVVPPVFLNSLHVYDRYEDYLTVDVMKEDQFVYGRCSNPTTAILEKSWRRLRVACARLRSPRAWLRRRWRSWRLAGPAATSCACGTFISRSSAL